MKSARIIILFFFLNSSQQSFALSPLVEAGPGKGLKVFVHNVCEYWSRVYVSEGVDSAGIHGSIGYLSCNQTPLQYVHSDSLLALDKINYFDIGGDGSSSTSRKIICTGNRDKILTHRLYYPNGYWCDSTQITPSYTLLSDSIIDAKVYEERIVVIRETNLTDNIIIYDSSFTNILFSQKLNMIPKMMSLGGSVCSILGIDSSGATALVILFLHNNTTFMDTVLQSTYLEPISFLGSQYRTYLIAESVDTVVHLLRYNWYDSTFIDTVIHSGSGIETYSWENEQFHFQPKFDSTGMSLDKKIFVFDGYRLQQRGIYNINKHLKVLCYPGDSYGYFPYIYAIPDSGQSDKYFLYDTYYYNLIDSGNTAANTVGFKADYRCPIKVDEYDDALVEWKAFPNPTSEYINLSASGLICGRDYKVDIVDSYGTIKHEETIHAKMTLTLPIENFAPGIYFIRIHTLKGFVIQKFVKM